MTRMLTRRLARLEAVRSKVARPGVVTVRAGETTEQALDRFFDGGEGWPVVVMPEPCRTIDERQARCAQRRANERLEARLSRLEAKTSPLRRPILVYECAEDWPEDQAQAFVADYLGGVAGPALIVRLNRFGGDGPPRVVSMPEMPAGSSPS